MTDEEMPLDEMIAELEAQGYHAPERHPELDAVDKLVAGREMNVAVHEGMGLSTAPIPHSKHDWSFDDYWDDYLTCQNCGARDYGSRADSPPEQCVQYPRIPNYSGDISESMVVLEHLKTLGWALGLQDMRLNPDPRPEDRLWWYEMYRWDDPEAKIEGVQFSTHDWELDGGANTLQECICQALLKTIALKNLTPPPVEGFVED